MNRKLIFITGASGALGRYLVPRLKERGFDLHLLYHRTLPEGSKESIEYSSGDLLNPESYRETLRRTSTVLHLGGVTYSHHPREYWDTNVLGTQALIHACEQAGVERFIHISTSAISEAGGAYSQSKREAERFVSQSHLNWIILRLAEVWGSGSKRGMDAILRSIQQHCMVPVFKSKKIQMAPIHCQDVFAALLEVLDRSDLKQVCLNLAGPEIFSHSSLVKEVAGLGGQKKLCIPLPLGFLKAVVQIGAFLSNRFPLVRDQMPRLTAPKSLDIRETQRLIHFQPKRLRDCLKL